MATLNAGSMDSNKVKAQPPRYGRATPSRGLTPPQLPRQGRCITATPVTTVFFSFEDTGRGFGLSILTGACSSVLNLLVSLNLRDST